MDVSSAQEPNCRQDQATYGDEDNLYRVSFLREDGEQGFVTNRFTIAKKGKKPFLSGWVLWTDEEPRSEAIVTWNCPGGDITGEELDICTIWKGVAYSVYSDGHVDLIPPGEETASSGILLPGFGPELKKSKAFADENLTKAPWEYFRFAECQDKTKQE